MAIKRGNILLTGTGGGLCTYVSKGRCIVRSISSLTGERVQKDPAFEGFRRSGNRMKEASPLAGSLYQQIPKEKRQFSLYRQLTGEVLKMIKQGMAKEMIIGQLQKLYIDPVLGENVQEKQSHDQANCSLQPIRRKAFAGQHRLPGFQYLGRVSECRRIRIWQKETIDI
jgi:hypothetical protein